MSILIFTMTLCFAATAGAWSYTDLPEPTVTPEQRTLIHSKVDDLKDTLLETMLEGVKYDSISRGSGGTTPTSYPFPVTSNATNQYEGDRKIAKYAWVKEVAEEMGFEVVVQYQDDKVIYVEIGDPDAPEMIYALSHLDSPTQSVNATNSPNWKNEDGEYDTDAYKKPYARDGWMYGAGLQDDSGPTLATLFSMKALMDAGLPMDRRIRVGMGIYEDGGPGTPSVANTLAYMDIPYYTSNPSFYDNWAYKSLNREEMPIAAFTSDSRFPVIMGNFGGTSGVIRSATISLADDTGKPFSLVSATAYGATKRTNDPTLVDYVNGSGRPIPSRVVIALRIQDVARTDIDNFRNGLKAAATAKEWSVKETAANPEIIEKVELREELVDGVSCLVIEINTDVVMEAATPHYGKNAVVWSMYLIDKAFGSVSLSYSNKLADAARGVADLFMRNGVEDYYGTYMGLSENNRIPENGCPLFMVSPFTKSGGLTGYAGVSLYNAATGVLTNALHIYQMYDDSAQYLAAQTTVAEAWRAKGWTLSNITSHSQPTLYLTHDNYLTALHLSSYRNSLDGDGFEDLVALKDISYPQGTTGGTLARNYFNKMNAFGAVLPGNERWWHAPNERMTEKSAVQMTKIFADGMLEMARYVGPGGAKFMWADIDGLNADRADLDLLDVTLDTYKDAKADVPSSVLGDWKLAAATKFDIPMFRVRGNDYMTAATIALGHHSSGVYLPVSSLGSETFVLPMRFEFKLTQDMLGVSDYTWSVIQSEDIADTMDRFAFNILQGSDAKALSLPTGADAGKYFFKRLSKYDTDAVYLSVHVTIKDDADLALTTVEADSKTDLFKLNDTWLASNTNPFPDQGKIEQRGFFLFGDGEKNARFESPTALYVTFNGAEEADPGVSGPDGGGSGGSSSNCNSLGFGALAVFGLVGMLQMVKLRKK